MTDSAEDIYEGYALLGFRFAKIFHILSARALATYRVSQKNVPTFENS